MRLESGDSQVELEQPLLAVHGYHWGRKEGTGILLRAGTEGSLDLGRALSHNPGLIQMKDPPLPLVGRNLNLSIIPEKKKQIGIKTHNRMAGGICGGGYSDAHAYEYGYIPSHQSISPGSAALKRGQSTCIFNNFLTW